ncbi:MAG: SDR family oxidoreductase [Acetobacteraceae bacterium]
MSSTLAAAGLARAGGSRPLEGKVALVTASTYGVGLAVVRALAAQGAGIGLNGGGDPDAIRILCQTLAARFDVPTCHDMADMADPDSVRIMVERVRRCLGAVDILVNTIPGIARLALADAPRSGDWETIVAVPLTSAFHITGAVLPPMRRRGFGRIVHVACTVGADAEPLPRMGLVMRHSLVGLTRTAALEGAADGITCNIVFPGPVRHRGLAGGTGPRTGLVPPDDVAAAVAFLCGANAGSITGAVLPMGRTGGGD